MSVMQCTWKCLQLLQQYLIYLQELPLVILSLAILFGICIHINLLFPPVHYSLPPVPAYPLHS